jgi:hypothetical protein
MAPDEVATRNRAAIKDGVADRFGSAGATPLTIKTVFHLTPDQQQRVDQLSANGQNPLTADELRRVLLDTEEAQPQAPAVLVREDALLKEFVARTRQEQLSEALLAVTPDGAAPAANAGGAPQPNKLSQRLPPFQASIRRAPLNRARGRALTFLMRPRSLTS